MCSGLVPYILLLSYSGIQLYVVSESYNNQFMMGSLGCIVTLHPMVRLIISTIAQQRAAFEWRNIYQHRRKWHFSKACNACALSCGNCQKLHAMYQFSMNTCITIIYAGLQGKDGRDVPWPWSAARPSPAQLLLRAGGCTGLVSTWDQNRAAHVNVVYDVLQNPNGLVPLSFWIDTIPPHCLSLYKRYPSVSQATRFLSSSQTLKLYRN